MDGTLWNLSGDQPYQIGTDSNYVDVIYGTPIKNINEYNITSKYGLTLYPRRNIYYESFYPKPSNVIDIRVTTNGLSSFNLIAYVPVAKEDVITTNVLY
jgi:hypothetical protein